jgi:hypothetical protein
MEHFLIFYDVVNIWEKMFVMPGLIRHEENIRRRCIHASVAMTQGVP